MKLPKPFHTARVGEALSSLTNYVREARSIEEERRAWLMAALVTAVASVVIVVRVNRIAKLLEERERRAQQKQKSAA
jgi:hypothetical protein